MAQEKKERIFISYKRVDKERVFAIKDGIEQATGEKCWIDLDGIESDAQFADVIISAINRCEVFLFMYSASHTKIVNRKKDWTIREISFAEKKDKRIVFVNIDNSPLTDWFELNFGTTQQVDATDTEKLAHLHNDLCSWLKIDIRKIQQDSYKDASKAEQDRLRKERELQERMAQAEAEKKALEEKTRLAEAKARKAEEEKRKAEEKAKQIEERRLAEKHTREGKQHTTTIISWEDAKKNAQCVEEKKTSVTNSKGTQNYNVGGKPSTKNILGVIRTLGEAIGVVVVMAIGGILIFGPTDPTILLCQDPNKLYDKGLKKEQNSNNKEDIAIFEYYHRAAKKGHIAAMNKVALHYMGGMNGVRKNPPKAIDWFNKAIENGNAEAALNLGYLYETGNGIKQDYKEAVKYYTMAAERGNAFAQHRLGNCYFTGTGVEQNQETAQSWYTCAAEQGYAAAQSMLGKCYQYGYGVSRDINKAILWYTKAAEQGHSEAQSDLGQCYALGSGVRRDYVKAVEWFTKAAEQGSSWSQNRLGHIYYDGAENVGKNYTEAIKWFRKAAEQGNEYSMYGLGKCYYNGYGVKKDLVEAEKWFKKAASKGHSASKKLLEKEFYPQTRGSKAGEWVSQNESASRM